MQMSPHAVSAVTSQESFIMPRTVNASSFTPIQCNTALVSIHSSNHLVLSWLDYFDHSYYDYYAIMLIKVRERVEWIS